MPILLIFLFFMLLSSAKKSSATYDEHEYIARGYTYIRTGDDRLKLRHPVLIDILASAPLLVLRDMVLPLDSPGWLESNFHSYASTFLWQANEVRADQIIFLSRLPIMLLVLILVSALFRWTKELVGLSAGVLAAILAAFDPNILAHGRLVTPDLGQTVFIFLSAFSWWRFLGRQNLVRSLLAGLSLGLAQAAGFPALILFPVLAIVTIVFFVRQGKRIRQGMAFLGRAICVIMLSLLVLWAIYRFSWGTVHPLGISLPAPYHWEELFDLLTRLGREDLAYLNGEVYRGGRFEFFIVAFIIKTPISTMLLLSAGFFTIIIRRISLATIGVWLLPIVYFGASLTSTLNIGYRHILPILPFCFVLAGYAILAFRSRWTKGIVLVLVGGLILTSLAVYPYYLTYFNAVAGGPHGGGRYLTVSDLDWGQDLPGLSDYLSEHDNAEIYLSYFGTAPPEHYGIRFKWLPGWPQRGNPERYPFHPSIPLPGIYAISIANLQGARFEEEPDLYSWFRDREPLAIIGNSIYLYEVPHLFGDSGPMDVSLSGVTLADLTEAIIEQRIGTNDLTLRWFDARRALVVPNGGSILAIGDKMPLADVFLNRFAREFESAESYQTDTGRIFNLYSLNSNVTFDNYIQDEMSTRFTLGSELSSAGIDGKVHFGNAASLLGYEIFSESAKPGEELSLMTVWQAEREVAWPLAIFVHLLDSEDNIIGQFDGLDVPATNWKSGDIIFQIHSIPLPTELPESALKVQVGLYRVDNLERLSAYEDASYPSLNDHVVLDQTVTTSAD